MGVQEELAVISRLECTLIGFVVLAVMCNPSMYRQHYNLLLNI